MLTAVNWSVPAVTRSTLSLLDRWIRLFSSGSIQVLSHRLLKPQSGQKSCFGLFETFRGIFSSKEEVNH